MGGRIAKSVESSKRGAVSAAISVAVAHIPRLHYPKWLLLASPKSAELSAVESRVAVIILHTANELRKKKDKGVLAMRGE